MANKVIFKLAGVTSAMSNQHVMVLDTDESDTVLINARSLNVDSSGNAEIDVTATGKSVGDAVRIYGSNFPSDGVNQKGFNHVGIVELIETFGFTSLTRAGKYEVTEMEFDGEFTASFYATANENGAHFFSSSDATTRLAINNTGRFIVKIAGSETTVILNSTDYLDGEVHLFELARDASNLMTLSIDGVDAGMALTKSGTMKIQTFGAYTGSSGVPGLAGFLYATSFTGITNTAAYATGVSSWLLNESGSDTGYIYVDAQGVNSATGVDITEYDEFLVIPNDCNVIVLAGQSNMVGRPSIEVGVDDDYSGLSNDTYQYRADYLSYSRAYNPLGFSNVDAGDMGLWLELVKGIQDGFDDRPIVLVTVAVGGTGFATNDWNKGDDTYEAAASMINHIMGNTNNTMKGFFWLQGENDADNSSDTYLADVTQFWSDIQADCPSLVGTPFVAAEILGSTTPAYVPIINADLATFVGTLTDAALVETDDLSLIDTWHYNAASLRTIGQRMATEYNTITGA